MPQGIVDPEDQEFISSLGHWTGDATWDPGPLGGWSGLAKFIIGVNPDIKTMRLDSPFITSPTNKAVALVLYTHVPTPYNPINRRLRITDGAYTFERPWSYQQFPDAWLAVGLDADLPADWDPLNISAFLDVQMAVLGIPGVAYADRASLTWVSAIQYLPIMGIG